MVKSFVLWHARSWVRAPLMLKDMFASMWVKRLPCHADHGAISTCFTGGESNDLIGQKARKQGIHPGFET